MTHAEHWTRVLDKAEERILGMFADGGDGRAEALLPRGVKTRGDLKRALAYAFAHGDCHERACAAISAAAWVQAHNELRMDLPERVPAK